MAGKRRQAEIISLEDRRRERCADQLREASRQMIEAEHALFVALRLAGHRGHGDNSQPLLPRPLAPVIQLPRVRPRRRRAA